MLRTRSIVAIGCLFALKCVMTPWADAEGDQQSSVPPPARQIRVAGWTVSGNLRLRFEHWDFFKAQTGDSSYGYGASLLRVSLERQFQTHDWLFEAAQPSLIGLPTDAVATPTRAAGLWRYLLRRKSGSYGRHLLEAGIRSFQGYSWRSGEQSAHGTI